MHPRNGSPFVRGLAGNIFHARNEEHPWTRRGRAADAPQITATALHQDAHSLPHSLSERVDVCLEPYEMEIQVRATSLQAKEIASLDDDPSHQSCGQGCSGVVTRLGTATSSFSVGDQVVALCPGALTTNVRISDGFAHRMPPSMSFEAGALLPSAYTTAYYCLVHVSRLERGETVLIHDAASPVGDAALQIATQLGAKVLMTTSIEEEKAYLLAKHGVDDNAVFSSLESDFVAGTRRATKGRGVDVLLNTLRGESLQASFSCMAPFGRFLEIGNSNTQANEHLEMSPFRRNVVFTSIDMNFVAAYKPGLASKVFQSAMRFVIDHNLKTSTRVAKKAWSELTEAVALMHSGSDVVLTCSDDERVLVSLISLLPLYMFNLPFAGRSKTTWTRPTGPQWYIPACRWSWWLGKKYSFVARSTWG